MGLFAGAVPVSSGYYGDSKLEMLHRSWGWRALLARMIHEADYDAACARRDPGSPLPGPGFVKRAAFSRNVKRLPLRTDRFRP